MSSGYPFQKPAAPKSAEWYFRKRRERRERKMGYAGFRLRIDQIGNRDNLYRCFMAMRKEGGPAPGLDGVRARDLSPQEVGWCMGELANAITNGTYLPQETRRVGIPKPGKTELRYLNIRAVGDRCVARAMNEAWAPFWETRFLPCSYGFRPGRGAWTMLADLEAAMLKSKRWVVVNADIRTAFDCVKIADIVDLHEAVLDKRKVKKFGKRAKRRSLALVKTIMCGNNPNREIGIDQGCPFSPLALNVILNQILDAPLAETVKEFPLWYRYADNLVYLSKSVPGGRKKLLRMANLLKPLGLVLKDDAEVVDLKAGGQTQLLGFSLSLEDNQIRYGIGPAAWSTLRQHLERAHSEPDPPTRASQALLGWIDSLGPAFKNGDVAPVLSTATEFGFREISRSTILKRWEASWSRWQAYQR